MHTSRTETQFHETKTVSLLQSNQVHMYRFSTYATVTAFIPISLRAFVPAINTCACVY